MAVSASNCVRLQNTAKKHQTTTGKYHRFIPSVPEKFDCRVKASIKPASLVKDLAIKDEAFKSSYLEAYTRKIPSGDRYSRSPSYLKMNYLRNVEEQFKGVLPSPLPEPLSEMKDAFRMKFCINDAEVKAPCELAKCNIVKLGSEQQPTIPCDVKGFWKWTDPYMTNYRCEYLPYDKAHPKITGRILTFYNEKDFTLPLAPGNKCMYDRVLFKHMFPLRLIPNEQSAVPFYGTYSEYQEHYRKQTFSYLYPYLQDRSTTCDMSLPPMAEYPNSAPPGMYLTEYSTLGGRAVRQVVDQETPKKEIVRTENCCLME